MEIRKFIDNFISLSEKASQMYVELPDYFKKFDKIVFVGMGNAGIVGDIMSEWLADMCPVPILSIKNHELPHYVDSDSLVILVSYSGNTPETLACLKQALKRECKTMGLSSGGALSDVMERNKIPFIKLPPGMNSGRALPSMLFAAASIMKSLGIRNVDECTQAPNIVKRYKKNIEDAAREISTEIKGSMPFIYGSSKSACLRFKTQLNEVANMHAKFELLSDFSHNEIAGWGGRQKNKISVIIFNEYSNSKEAAELIKNVLNNVRGKAKIIQIYSKGRNSLESILYLICLGDTICHCASIIIEKGLTAIER